MKPRMHQAAPMVDDPAAGRSGAPDPDVVRHGLSVSEIHQLLNTYEVTDREPGIHDEGTQHSVVGANRRRLIVRPQKGGVWIGGCEVQSVSDLHRLIAVLTGMAVGLEIAERNGAGPICYCGTGREHGRGSGYYCRSGGTP